MSAKQPLQQAFEVGTQFLELSRERVEAFVKELVKAGELSKGKAQRLIDDLVERSRQGTDELRKLIRREVSELGVATRDDLARLEARLSALEVGVTHLAEPEDAPPAGKPSATKASGPKGAGPSRPAAAKKATKQAGKKAAPAKKPVAARKAASKTSTKTGSPGGEAGDASAG